MITGAPTYNSSQPSVFSVEPNKSADEISEASATKPSTGTQVEGVKVTLSGVGLQKAANERSANANKDIEESGLPDQVQKLLKMIRELKQKIQEKQSEMQALMADQSMSPETKQTKISALQTTLSTLTASLMTASASLEKLSKNGSLSAAQVQQAAKLAMKS
ncbi:coiled-coil domain-containing protein 60 [Pseudomonas corrugata]|uniref:Chemotaxis protein n=1 Tax=Pseudomonas corrugata TaxID=47879 RepID=A0A3M3EPH7_9PSED|nr:coiled-coil domain-containing protein 60 [Pseudomonas corrugata]MDU9021226.1 coiled-coil domain-containing protein 60 [Pseudomonas corrugata]MDU9031726.1 coiled-coil domain-containing protein 60 [Pseudomonas corrugata]MDU9037250.1 coiled-coil domain-containing protein 60 [Pseudomonas corrugata]RMM51384.1 hypothetical protein ALQ77_01069 [Pseudomonas corrugata]UZD97431.1 coiled-coil domain-containing protein 60 [Pseudomonas corrugata]